MSACGDDDSAAPPADVSGTYTVSTTNNTNDCNLENFAVGAQNSNITFVISQNGGAATGELKGLANLFFLKYGIGPLSGTVDGSHVNMAATGSAHQKQGACDYQVRATVDVLLSGNTVNGSIAYSTVTNNDASCGTLQTCSSTSSVAGSRPPK